MALEHGIIGNCRTCALITEGRIEWWCFPSFDSPSVFAHLLDEERGGIFGIEAHGYDVSHHYLGDTNILETVFSSPDAEFRVVDFFLRHRKYGRLVKDNRIYRLVQPLRGTPRVRINFDPRPDYARGEAVRTVNEHSITVDHPRQIVSLYTDARIAQFDDLALEEEHFFVISCSDAYTEDVNDVKESLELTRDYWEDYVRRAQVPHDLRNEAIRSALVLKLLTYEDTGAIIAAATTSLPEIIGGSRNWDYRYCWLRDSSFTITALQKIGHFDEAARYMEFLKRIAFTCDISKNDCDSDLQIVYGVRGEKELPEETLEHLSGYEGSRPVRIGNAAYTQKQIDVAGEVIDAIHEYYCKGSRPLDDGLWGLVTHLVNFVIREWNKKDNGIWEFRGIEEHFTFSKLMAWVALERALNIAHHEGIEPPPAWQDERDHVRASILDNAFNETQNAFTMYYGSEYLDASVLLMPAYGFIDAQDPPMKATIDAIEKQLASGPLVMRYNMPDDFGKQENAFLICSFWLIDALTLSGQRDKAREYLGKMFDYCNGQGLFSEDLEISSQRLVGNFPQAYTHIAIINSIVRLNGGG